MLTPKTTKQFEKDKEKSRKQKNKDFSQLNYVLRHLIEERLLDPQYCDHPLSGKWRGFRDCHIQNDWVLIYRVDKAEKKLILVRLGSHSELF